MNIAVKKKNMFGEVNNLNNVYENFNKRENLGKDVLGRHKVENISLHLKKVLVK
jgi:hypothetical protein